MGVSLGQDRRSAPTLAERECYARVAPNVRKLDVPPESLAPFLSYI